MTAWTLEPLVPEFVRQFEAYVPSRPDPELMALYGVPRLFRLNNNENPLGPPAAAQEVLRRFPPPRAAVYPSGDSFYLRRRSGRHSASTRSRSSSATGRTRRSAS